MPTITLPRRYQRIERGRLVTYHAGEPIAVADRSEAQTLLARFGVVAGPAASNEADESGPDDRPSRLRDKPSGEDLITEIVDAAIRLVDDHGEAFDGGHFTASGKPRVDVLEIKLGYDISSADRDEAWRRLQSARSARG
jgi:hypothetical protein